MFNRARLCRRTEIEVSSGSQLLALEWLVLGRAAHGEKISGGSIKDSWRVKKDGRLVWVETFRATDDVLPHLSRKALLSDCAAIATLLYFGPEHGRGSGVSATMPLRLNATVGRRSLASWWSLA